MQASRMAELFSIDPSSLDAGSEESESPVGSFEQKTMDLQSVLIPKKNKTKSPPKDDNDLIKDALKMSHKVETKDLNPDTDCDLEPGIPGDILESTRRDIKNLEKEIFSETETETETDPILDELDTNTKNLEEDIPNTKVVSADNPLELSGLDLKAYHSIKEKFPDVFVLYDGSLGYREFYRYKVHSLRHLLGQFPLLDIKEMRNELSQIHTNHFIGEDKCTPETIRVKLDAAYMNRSRLSSLLTTALEQYYAWERFIEILKGKLWKDHEMKGAYKRDALTIEHLSDMESYVTSLKGFIESAKQYDAMLKAAADSLSRQLTCIQLDEHAVTQRVDYQPQKHHQNSQNEREAIDLDGLDSVDINVVVNAPKPKNTEAVTVVSYGGEHDEISQLC